MLIILNVRYVINLLRLNDNNMLNYLKGVNICKRKAKI